MTRAEGSNLCGESLSLVLLDVYPLIRVSLRERNGKGKTLAYVQVPLEIGLRTSGCSW